MPTLVVISDLHMGSGSIDDFELEIEKHFIAFLEDWRANNDGTELVINGDLLDFVQAQPYRGRELRAESKDGIPLCFTEEQSLQKLHAIYDEHKVSFRAMGSFLAHRPENRLVLLPGNHDADFYWPAVQQQFKKFVCGDDESASQRLIYWLDSVYQPSTFPGVWIEHGHQHDPVNSFFIDDEPCWSADNNPIRLDRTGTKRLYECIGTRFMIQFINGLDEKYPYVDNIKPFSRFLQLFGASALRGFGSLQAAVAVGAMNAFLAKTLVTHPGDVLKLPSAESPTAAKLISAAFEKATPARQKAFIQAVRDRGYELNTSPKILLSRKQTEGSLLEFLSENLDVLDNIESEPSEETLKLGASFSTNESDELRSVALKIVADATNMAEVVIMGHTHEVVDEPAYINTGSWTRYYKLKEKERLRPWSILRAGSWKNFPYQLNYALARPGARPAAVFRTYK